MEKKIWLMREIRVVRKSSVEIQNNIIPAVQMSIENPSKSSWFLQISGLMYRLLPNWPCGVMRRRQPFIRATSVTSFPSHSEEAYGTNKLIPKSMTKDRFSLIITFSGDRSR